MAQPYIIPPHHNHDEVYVKIGEGGGGVTDHGLLTGLEDNDHPQYRLASEAIDHGALSGLADDDHSQYLNNARHDATARHTLGTVVPHDDHGALSGLSDNDHPQYLLAASGKAADSDKLDGLDSTDFVLASGLGTATRHPHLYTEADSSSIRYHQPPDRAGGGGRKPAVGATHHGQTGELASVTAPAQPDHQCGYGL